MVIINEPINIFLSHRHEDAEAVLEFKTKLEELSAGKIKCFQSSAPGQIQAGVNWRKKIREELNKADVLILLFTDPSQTWDWCLYEVGLFTNLSKENDDSRIICICSYEDNPPPSPLESRQFVRANQKEIKQLLNDLFKTPNYFPRTEEAVNPNLADKTIEELAGKLSGLLSKKSKKERNFTNWLTIHIDEPKTLTENLIPPNSRIEPYRDCLELFGMARTPATKPYWTWADLLNIGQEKNCFSDSKVWEKSIAIMAFAAKEGQTFKQEAQEVKSEAKKCFYRPVLTKYEIESSGAMSFQLIFVTQPQPER